MYINNTYAYISRFIVVLCIGVVSLTTITCISHNLRYNAGKGHQNIDETKTGKEEQKPNKCWIDLIDQNGKTTFYEKMQHAAEGDPVNGVQASFIYKEVYATKSLGIKDELFLENLKKDEPFPENLKKAIMLARKSNELILSQEDQKKLVTVVDCFGNSVLFHAALNNDCKTAGYLMELGACPFYYKGVGMEPIEVVRKLNNKNMQELLLNSKYPANQGSHNNTCSGLHKVLDKKYSMDSMLDARKLGPISGSNAFPGLQGLQEYVSSSTTYPVRE